MSPIFFLAGLGLAAYFVMKKGDDKKSPSEAPPGTTEILSDWKQSALLPGTSVDPRGTFNKGDSVFALIEKGKDMSSMSQVLARASVSEDSSSGDLVKVVLVPIAPEAEFIRAPGSPGNEMPKVGTTMAWNKSWMADPDEVVETLKKLKAV